MVNNSTHETLLLTRSNLSSQFVYSVLRSHIDLNFKKFVREIKGFQTTLTLYFSVFGSVCLEYFIPCPGPKNVNFEGNFSSTGGTIPRKELHLFKKQSGTKTRDLQQNVGNRWDRCTFHLQTIVGKKPHDAKKVSRCQKVRQKKMYVRIRVHHKRTNLTDSNKIRIKILRNHLY